MALAPVRGAGDSLGDRPRGDFTRWVPNVAPPLLREAEPGVLGLLGAPYGPFSVGVIARLVAAMVYMYLLQRLREYGLQPKSAMIREANVNAGQADLGFANASLHCRRWWCGAG